MRSQSDYGVVVFLDSRITSRRWGGAVWASLPETKRGTTIEHARAHLAQFGGEQ